MFESSATEGTASASPAVLVLVILGQRQLDSLQLYLFLKSSQFSFLKHCIKTGGSQLFVWRVTGQKRNY